MKRFLITLCFLIVSSSGYAGPEFKFYGTVNTDSGSTSVLTMKTASGGAELPANRYIRIVNTTNVTVYAMVGDSTTAPAVSITNCTVVCPTQTNTEIVFWGGGGNSSILTLKTAGAITSGSVIAWGR